MPLSPDVKAQRIAILRTFISRADGLHMKGKARDNAALEYVVGAACACQVTGQTELMNTLLMVATFTAARGALGFVEFMKE